MTFLKNSFIAGFICLTNSIGLFNAEAKTTSGIISIPSPVPSNPAYSKRITFNLDTNLFVVEQAGQADLTNFFNQKNCHNLLSNTNWANLTYLFDNTYGEMAVGSLPSTVISRSSYHFSNANIPTQCTILMPFNVAPFNNYTQGTIYYRFVRNSSPGPVTPATPGSAGLTQSTSNSNRWNVKTNTAK